MKTILKTLVGSRAHGTYNDSSDYDFRGVYVIATDDILSLTKSQQQSNWVIDGKQDDTSYELEKFLLLSSKCNPSILEMYGAPIIEQTEEGAELLKLFPYVWNTKEVFNAFRGYGANQRKKFFDNNEQRANKYLEAWMRTLWQANYLLSTGKITCNFKGTDIFDDLMLIRSGEFDRAEQLSKIFELERTLEKTYENTPEKITDMEKLNEFLLKIRHKN